MKRNKCADTSGLEAESFIYGNLGLHKCLLDVFNNLDAVTRVGVTLFLLCCQKVAICFCPIIGVRVLYTENYIHFLTKWGNIGETSVHWRSISPKVKMDSDGT